MKENQKSEQSSNTPSSATNPNSQHNQNGSTVQEVSETSEDESKPVGDEYIREGHGHDYSVPFAGEDGGTEDQAESKDENPDTAKKQPAEQGKTAGENSII